jgi:hypothetical protein
MTDRRAALSRPLKCTSSSFFSVGISSSLVRAVLVHCFGEEAVEIPLYIGVVDDGKARVSATTRSVNFVSRTTADTDGRCSSCRPAP